MRKQGGFTLIELLIVVAIIGIIAAIAVPSLLRARISANESATVGDTRTVISAEVAFHSANDGFYGVLTCLSVPSDAACIPGYAGPTFLDPSLTALSPKSGYLRDANYDAGGIPGQQAGDRTTYCYQAQPLTPQVTGTRSFGGDASGLLGAAQGGVNCCQAGFLLPACPPLH